MSPDEAINELVGFDAQIVHVNRPGGKGVTVFMEIAEVIRDLRAQKAGPPEGWEKDAAEYLAYLGHCYQEFVPDVVSIIGKAYRGELRK